MQFYFCFSFEEMVGLMKFLSSESSEIEVSLTLRMLYFSYYKENKGRYRNRFRDQEELLLFMEVHGHFGLVCTQVDRFCQLNAKRFDSFLHRRFIARSTCPIFGLCLLYKLLFLRKNCYLMISFLVSSLFLLLRINLGTQINLFKPFPFQSINRALFEQYDLSKSSQNKP